MNTKWIKEELNAYTNKSVNDDDILIAYERIAHIFGLNSPSNIKLNNHFGIDLISKKYRLFSDTDTSLDEIYDDIEDMMILSGVSSPLASAASTMDRATRSLMDPPTLAPSVLAARMMRGCGKIRFRRTMGAAPTRERIFSCSIDDLEQDGPSRIIPWC